MTMLSCRVAEADAGDLRRWAERLGVDLSVLVRDALSLHLVRLAAEDDVARLLPVTDTIARRAGEHLRRFRRPQGIDLVDYVVAATTELNEAELATLNVRHFPMFKELRPPW